VRKHIKKNNEPLISVITPCYNRLEWLPLTLQSLSDQTYKNFEVQIVNDFGESPKEILNKFPNLNIVYNEHASNLGLASARNTGMKNSNGDYFVFLDSDDQLMPLALEFRMSMIKKYDAEIVYTRGLRDIYEKRDNGYALVNNTTYWTSSFNRDILLIQNVAQCNSVLFSRDSWDDTNNYKLDSGLFTGEDFDFWQELSRKNDFVELLTAAASQDLDKIKIIQDSRYACTVVAVSGDYPGDYEKGFTITGLENVKAKDSILFHAGSKTENERVVTNGGRVICITSYGDSVTEAVKKSLNELKKISYTGMNYRKDIGFEFQ